MSQTDHHPAKGAGQPLKCERCGVPLAYDYGTFLLIGVTKVLGRKIPLACEKCGKNRTWYNATPSQPVTSAEQALSPRIG